MKKLYILPLLSILLAAAPAIAADDVFGIDDDEDIFSAGSSSTQEKKEKNGINISSFLTNKLPESTAKNINKAEKVFCYTVDYTTAGYDGYTINDLALKGSCGELSQSGKDLIKTSIFDNNSLYSNSVDKCSISPKIILRYVNGADHTDVLFSSPCQSLTFFHGRDITTVNAAPGAAIIDQIVKAYSGLEEPYRSPALLGQMVANGQPMTQNQKEILRRMAPAEAPVKKWNTQPQPQENTALKAKSGWNKLR